MKKKGIVIWLTGLSGAGKTTISLQILKQLQIRNPIHLDGDKLRDILSIRKENTFTKNNRNKIGMIYSKLSKYLSDQGHFVVTSVMALNKSVFTWNKRNIKNYFEVYLKVPKYELINRDPKGIYKKFKKGEVKNISGFDIPYDKPHKPDMIIVWNKDLTIRKISDKILNKINEKYPSKSKN
jgi:cytidine diphosphoramidate kinase